MTGLSLEAGWGNGAGARVAPGVSTAYKKVPQRRAAPPARALACQPSCKAWFPGGVDDPKLELVEVQIRHAEYWDIHESKMTQLLKMATAAVTGSPPKMGEHRELNMG